MTTTMWLLIAQHQGRPMLPVEEVARTYFNLSCEKFVGKVRAGTIELPLLALDEESQKSPKFVMLTDLAELIDKRHAKAAKLAEQMRV